MPAVGSLESDILRTIRRLPFLTTYSIRVCPITDMIMEAMDETSIKLEGIKIWLQEVDTRRQFNFLLYSKQINSISELTIIDTIHSTRAISNNLLIFNLVTNLSCLTVLKLHTQPGTTTYSYNVLIEIIHRLNNLEALLIHEIYDNRRELPITLYTYLPKKSKLTYLDLQVTGKKHHVDSTNALFKVIFQSCSALKRFELHRNLYFNYFACLSLDLSQHELLEEVFIELYEVEYYTFDKNKPRIMYARSGIKLKVPHSETVKSTYYMELLCNKRTSIRMTPALTEIKMLDCVYDTDDSTDMESD